MCQVIMLRDDRRLVIAHQVILRREDKITLYCKGADSTINERLHESSAHMKNITTTHLEVILFCDLIQHHNAPRGDLIQ